MNSYNKLVKNSTIYAIGNFGSKFITILMLPFYTRLLSQADYGQIDIIITTISLLMPLFTANIVAAVIRFSLDKKNYSYGEVLTNSAIFIIIGFIALLGIYPFISKIGFLQQYGFIFYMLFLIQSIHTSIKQFARSMGLSKVYMISDMLYSFVFVCLNIVFILFLKMGVLGYFTAMILAKVVDLIYLLIKTSAYKYLNTKHLDKNKIKKMFIYCLPLIPNSIMWWVMAASDRFILIHYIGLKANGIYAVANKFPAMISILSGVFFQAWQVSAIEEVDNPNKDTFYSNVFNLFFFIMVIASSIYLIFNKLIIKIMVSSNFYSAWKFAPILILGVVFCSFSGFLGTNYTAMKKTTGALYTSVVGAAINFILNILLIPKYGIYGASIATMVSFLSMWLFRIVDTRSFVKIKYPTFKIILSLILLGIQIMIGYFEIELITFSIVNALSLLFIIILSFEFTKKPFFVGCKKISGLILKK